MEGQPVGLAFFVLSFDKVQDVLSPSASSGTVGGVLRQVLRLAQ